MKRSKEEQRRWLAKAKQALAALRAGRYDELGVSVDLHDYLSWADAKLADIGTTPEEIATLERRLHKARAEAGLKELRVMQGEVELSVSILRDDLKLAQVALADIGSSDTEIEAIQRRGAARQAQEVINELKHMQGNPDVNLDVLAVYLRRAHLGLEDLGSSQTEISGYARAAERHWFENCLGDLRALAAAPKDRRYRHVGPTSHGQRTAGMKHFYTLMDLSGKLSALTSYAKKHHYPLTRLGTSSREVSRIQSALDREWARYYVLSLRAGNNRSNSAAWMEDILKYSEKVGSLKLLKTNERRLAKLVVWCLRQPKQDHEKLASQLVLLRQSCGVTYKELGTSKQEIDTIVKSYRAA